jgi:hypothetical protein
MELVASGGAGRGEFVATTEPARHDRDAWRERLRRGA